MSCRKIATYLGRSHTCFGRHLRHAHRRRRRQGSSGRGSRLFAGRIDIARRPQPVAGRTRFGEMRRIWSALWRPGGSAQLQGAQKSLSAAGQGPKQDSRRLGRAVLPCLRELPPALRQTLTLDNGRSGGWSGQTSCTSFCRPHSPWQHSASESEGDLLRQYCPRDISLHKIREKPLVKAAHRLNRRPRKCLAASVLLKPVTWPSPLHWQAECTICHGRRIIGGPGNFLPPFPRCLRSEHVSRFFTARAGGPRYGARPGAQRPRP